LRELRLVAGVRCVRTHTQWSSVLT
jgi:hypothetical protein